MTHCANFEVVEDPVKDHETEEIKVNGKDYKTSKHQKEKRLSGTRLNTL